MAILIAYSILYHDKEWARAYAHEGRIGIKANDMSYGHIKLADPPPAPGFEATE